MKFISVRDLRTSPAQIWKALPVEKEMVITNNGKPIALLTPISDQTMEETIQAVRTALASTAVKTIQADSIASGRSAISDEEIDAEITAVRRDRQR